jgi:hypothetical protein
MKKVQIRTSKKAQANKKPPQRGAVPKRGIEIRLTSEGLVFDPVGWDSVLVTDNNIEIGTMKGARMLIIRNIRAHRIGEVYYIEGIGLVR